MKLLSIAVPCYNSEAYMENCIKSLLVGGDEVEILIVDDGSGDGTAQIADRLEREHPGIVRAIHQPNKGHGGAILDVLRRFSGEEEPLDLLISNFVYNKEDQNRHKVMQYRRCLPVGRVFSWDEANRFPIGKYILMHSVIFRTQMLRDSGLKLPEHTFYVDNIYVFNPLPYVRRMYYLDVNFYYYFIGREDQSVQEDVMIKRLDQQARVNRIMIDYYTDPRCMEMIGDRKTLKQYMFNYLEIITTITSVLALRSGKEEHIRLRDETWDYLREKDEALYKKMRRRILGRAMNVNRRFPRMAVISAYHIAQRIFNFN